MKQKVFLLNKGVGGTKYPSVTMHKRRYHRSPSSSTKRQRYRGPDILRPNPYFETRVDKETGLGARNITTVEGGRAIFLCRLRHLGHNRTVSYACATIQINGLLIYFPDL